MMSADHSVDHRELRYCSPGRASSALSHGHRHGPVCSGYRAPRLPARIDAVAPIPAVRWGSGRG